MTDRGFASFEAWREEVLDAEEAALSRLDKKLEAETHWLHRGVTARRKRNMGRLRNLELLRRERREQPVCQAHLELRAPTDHEGLRATLALQVRLALQARAVRARAQATLSWRGVPLPCRSRSRESTSFL